MESTSSHFRLICNDVTLLLVLLMNASGRRDMVVYGVYEACAGPSQLWKSLETSA